MYKESKARRLLPVITLVQELAEYERAPKEVTVSLSHFEESGFGEHPVWWAFVAETQNGICGFALYYIRYSTWKGQRIYLEDIYIESEMRGEGAGKKLFDAVMNECKQKGFNGMVWQVLDWNEPAINFYRKYNAKFDDGWINCSIDF